MKTASFTRSNKSEFLILYMYMRNVYYKSMKSRSITICTWFPCWARSAVNTSLMNIHTFFSLEYSRINYLYAIYFRQVSTRVALKKTYLFRRKNPDLSQDFHLHKHDVFLYIFFFVPPHPHTFPRISKISSQFKLKYIPFLRP